jgi:hypothetical protein
MRLTLHTFLTLDGVMQAPGAPDEDPDGGSPMAAGHFPTVTRTSVPSWSAGSTTPVPFCWEGGPVRSSAATGRASPDPADPVAGKLNALPKYVASTRLASAEWHNSSLLRGDVATEVAKLKELPGDELQVHGSGELAQTLIEHDLIDEYRLVYFPVHLGQGKKLFRMAPGRRPCGWSARRPPGPASSSPATRRPGSCGTAHTRCPASREHGGRR